MGKLRYRERITTSVDIKLLEEFRSISQKTDIPLSKLFDRAMKMLIAAKNKKQNKS